MSTAVGVRWAGAALAVTVGPLVLAPLIAPRAGTATPLALGGLIFLGSAVHYASSGALFSLRGVRELASRSPVRLIVAPAVMVLSCLVVMAVVTTSGVDVVLYVFFAWQFVHYTKQNVGVACVTAIGGRVPPPRGLERRAIVVAGVAGVVAVLARASLLDLPSVMGSTWLLHIAQCTFIASVGIGVILLARRPQGQRPLGYVGVYLAALLFSLPAFVFSSPYAALSGMTIAHGLQYLMVVSLVTAPRQRDARTLGRVVLVVNAVILAALAIHVSAHVPGPSLGAHLLFGVYLGIATAHFVVDSTVWKMSDPSTRAIWASRLPRLLGSPRTNAVSLPYVADRYSGRQ
jgi:hypothetical protein